MGQTLKLFLKNLMYAGIWVGAFLAFVGIILTIAFFSVKFLVVNFGVFGFFLAIFLMATLIFAALLTMDS